MVEAAAVVEVVAVDSITPWDTKAFFAEERAEALAGRNPRSAAHIAGEYDHFERVYETNGASTVTFRVVETLKGQSTTLFSIGAFVVGPENDGFGLEELTNQLPATGPLPTAEQLYNLNALTDLTHFESAGCATPMAVRLDGYYLVFRDAAGELLRDAVPVRSRHQRGQTALDGPNFEAVNETGDVWLESVRAAAGR